ncbi:MAG: hypothetical protein SF029_15270 [bacterium]|nr:hypothetical protein [bacterium]
MTASETATGADSSRIDRLLDAIELVKADRREEARQVLRELIREDSDFEAAWLWMSVAVDSLDQSSICLDNVLRVNPGNIAAAGALYRMRESEMRMEKRRAQLRFYRDMSLTVLWLLVIGILFAVLFTYSELFNTVYEGGQGLLP